MGRCASQGDLVIIVLIDKQWAREPGWFLVVSQFNSDAGEAKKKSLQNP